MRVGVEGVVGVTVSVIVIEGLLVKVNNGSFVFESIILILVCEGAFSVVSAVVAGVRFIDPHA